MAERDRERHDLLPGGRGLDDRHAGLGQLDADTTEHAHGFQPGALALAADGIGNVRRPQVGGIGENLRQIEPTVLALKVGDGEAANMDRARGVEFVPDVDDA